MPDLKGGLSVEEIHREAARIEARKARPERKQAKRLADRETDARAIRAQGIVVARKKAAARERIASRGKAIS